MYIYISIFIYMYIYISIYLYIYIFMEIYKYMSSWFNQRKLVRISPSLMSKSVSPAGRFNHIPRLQK